MPSINFSPGTVIPSTWLNDIDETVFSTIPNIISGVTPVALATAATTASIVTNGVYTVGDQTVAGVKTFSSSPVVPTPVNATDAVNKTYVDTALGSYSRIQTYTAQATTSGISVDFTSIPSWAKKVAITFDQVSTTSSGDISIQLGTSSGVVTTGYSTQTSYLAHSSTVNVGSSTSAIWNTGSGASTASSGVIILQLHSGNTWVASGSISRVNDNAMQLSSGRVPLASALTSLRVLAVSTSFDSGSVNIIVEG